jgi:hypothetical protein
MKRVLAIATLAILAPVILLAAEFTGKVIDSKSSDPLMGASIQVFDSKSKLITGAKTNKKGAFELSIAKNGDYTFHVSFVGYEKFEKSVKISDKTKKDLGIFELVLFEIQTDEALVTAKMPIGETKEDTASFNAGAYKTAPDAVAEDVIKKMPGVEVSADGSIKAQGESVKKVLVDGKPFFGDDPTIAMKNIPADMIDKIQIFDKSSDQAEFSGMNDGETSKAINIITKSDRRKGQIGKFNAGYGSDQRYAGSFSLGLMNASEKLFVLGLFNNTNQQNFSFEDIMGVFGGGGGRMMRPPAGAMPKNGGNSELRPGGGMFSNISSFMVSPTDGIAKTNSIGANYTNVFNNNFEVNGSYFFNSTNNDNTQNTDRNYFISADSMQLYNQDGSGRASNLNHRLSLKATYEIDSNNAIMWTPVASYQDNEMRSLATTVNQYENGALLNQSKNNYSTDYTGSSFSSDLQFRHKFETKGRTISATISNSYSDKDGYSLQNAFTSYYQNAISDTINQKADLFNKNIGIGAELVYSEPITDNSQLQVNYNFSNKVSNSDKTTNSLDEAKSIYNVLDTALSNKFENTFTTHKAGLGYVYSTKALTFNAYLNYQNSTLNSEQTYPYKAKVDYETGNLLPSMMLKLNFDKSTNMRLRYRTSVMSPSVTQLQEVVDNSNPLQLSVGNSGLKPQYSHAIMARFGNMSPDMSQMLMLFGGLNFRNNYIANSYFTAARDTVINNINVKSGGQLTRPVNLDGFWDANLFFGYGFPVSFIMSNLNLGGGGRYSKTPGLINDKENTSNTYSLMANMNLGSNISQELSFNINGSYSYNITQNSLKKQSDVIYNNYNVFIDFNWIFWEGFFINATSQNMMYYGKQYKDGKSNVYLLNLAFGTKLFKNSAEIKLTCYDVLNNNKSISNNTTDYYTEIVKSTALKQYFLLSFSYNFKNFGGGGGMPMNRPHRFDD